MKKKIYVEAIAYSFGDGYDVVAEFYETESDAKKALAKDYKSCLKDVAKVTSDYTTESHSDGNHFLIEGKNNSSIFIDGKIIERELQTSPVGIF